MMEHGYIKIKEDAVYQLRVESKIVEGSLWITQHEIADLFGVFVSSVDANLRGIPTLYIKLTNSIQIKKTTL